MIYLAKTLAGLEPILEKELQQLGAKNILPLRRAVQFVGDQRLLYRANYELRTALRILLPIHFFKANHPNFFYKRIKQFDWSQYLGLDKSFAITPVVNSQYYRHSQFIALKMKDAIVDQFRDKTGERPNIDTKNPDVSLHLHIQEDKVNILLDSSGEALFKRGYKSETLEAPINEVLAAGMLQIAGWPKEGPFIDPMCGSGTLLIEAAMLAHNIPAQVCRHHFAFMKWKDYDKALWQEVKNHANAQKRDFDFPLVGGDKSSKAVKIALKNAQNAGLKDLVQIKQGLFQSMKVPEGQGLLLMNPPYDERLLEFDINSLYESIGDKLKKDFSGYEAWIISSNKEAMKHVGLRAAKKMTLLNGKLECKFHKYELYRGSKKKKAQSE